MCRKVDSPLAHAPPAYALVPAALRCRPSPSRTDRLMCFGCQLVSSLAAAGVAPVDNALLLKKNTTA